LGAYEIGSLLAGIHLNRAAGYGDLTQENNLSTDPRIYFASKFEESFAECESNLPKELLKQISNYYKDNINFLKDVDGPCIIHRDFRPGNIIVNNGKLQGVIDWASGRASFAEEDFCPLELGEWSLNSTIKQEFLDGYSSVRPVPNYSAIMPLFKLNRLIATIGFMVKSGTWNGNNASLYQTNCQTLKKFFNQDIS
jgi:Ser/Thr protein kinase RdoA (MazF antagonist)